MKRLQRAAILAGLIENLKDSGSWCGETHIQKSTYFLQELMDVPLGFDFILYKHGPYSFDLRDELTSMRADMLLELQPQPYPYGPSLLPGVGSEQIKKLYANFVSQYTEQIEFVTERLGGKRVADLERLATALYVSRNLMKGSPVESRAQKINELKPHVSLDEAREAVDTVDLMVDELNSLNV